MLAINFEWAIGCDKDIEPQVELLPANEQRLLEVARDDVGLLLAAPPGCAPFLDL